VITNRILKPAVGEQIVAGGGNLEKVIQEAEIKDAHLIEEVKQSTQGSGETQPIVNLLKQSLIASLFLPIYQDRYPGARVRGYQQFIKYLNAGNLKTSPWRNGDAYAWSVLLGWLFTSNLGRSCAESGFEDISRSWVDEWMLNKIIVSALNDLGLDERSNWRATILIKLLTTHHGWWKQVSTASNSADGSVPYNLLLSMLSDSDALAYLGVNRYQDVLWFNKEAFEDLVWWLMVIASVEISSNLEALGQSDRVGNSILPCFKVISGLLSAAQTSGYKLEKLLELIK